MAFIYDGACATKMPFALPGRSVGAVTGKVAIVTAAGFSGNCEPFRSFHEIETKKILTRCGRFENIGANVMCS